MYIAFRAIFRSLFVWPLVDVFNEQQAIINVDYMYFAKKSILYLQVFFILICWFIHLF